MTAAIWTLIALTIAALIASFIVPDEMIDKLWYSDSNDDLNNS